MGHWDPIKHLNYGCNLLEENVFTIPWLVH